MNMTTKNVETDQILSRRKEKKMNIYLNKKKEKKKKRKRYKLKTRTFLCSEMININEKIK